MNSRRLSPLRFLGSAALLAIGLAAGYVLLLGRWPSGNQHRDVILGSLLCVCTAVMIGAGVLCPFRQTILGACLGFAVLMLLLLLWYLLLPLAGGSGGG